MKKEVEEALDKAHEAKNLLRHGKISMDEAKRRVEPYILLVNEGGKRLAKEFGNTFKPVSATGFLR